jgi:hypothetical protein
MEDESVQSLILGFKALSDNPISYMRPVVLVLAGELRHRIHVEGKKADGSRIGTYSRDYMRIRVKNKRGPSTEMIWSLTRQMEQDFVAIAQTDLYGLGFNNSHNFDKATWLDAARPGVYALSESEIQLAEQTITDYINGVFG